MIKALVVDDERIVRQGLISLTDWTKFNIEFVAEAKDGLQALNVLNDTQIDLMFVDITMPHMNGFELIKHVQQKYSHIKFIILTCHHEFDDVKEALQLGVLDYIVKTLLDRENVIDIMSKIKDRFEKEQSRFNVKTDMSYEGGLFLLTSLSATDTRLLQLSKQLNTTFVEVVKGLFNAKMITPNTLARYNLTEDKLLGRWLSVPALKSFDEVQLLAWLKENSHTYVMYDESTRVIMLNEERLQQTRSYKSNQLILEQWRNETKQYRWLIYSQDFLRWISLTEQVKPKADELLKLVEQLYRQYVRLIDWDQATKAALQAEHLLTWQNINQWCQQLSLHIRGRMGDASLSQDVAVSLLKAVSIMKQRLSDDITQEDIAYSVGMSRSYFSQCFKRFYGSSFGDLLRLLRIEEAKRLLCCTPYTISDIAHQVGFVDAKYFSRTFKQFVNMYPSEYRTSHLEVKT